MGRHEAMAWAMLATPKGTPAPAVIAAAQVVEPTAPQVLSGGKVFSAEGMSEQEKLNLIVNTLEFFSLKRKMRELRRLLQRSASEETAPLLRQISELQKQINEAGERLSAN